MKSNFNLRNETSLKDSTYKNSKIDSITQADSTDPMFPEDPADLTDPIIPIKPISYPSSLPFESKTIYLIKEGDSYEQIGQLNSAISSYQEALLLEPTNKAIFFKLYKIFKKKKIGKI